MSLAVCQYKQSVCLCTCQQTKCLTNISNTKEKVRIYKNIPMETKAMYPSRRDVSSSESDLARFSRTPIFKKYIFIVGTDKMILRFVSN